MARKRLLVVEDEDSVLVGMRRYFQRSGFDVDCAREREEAEALVAYACYDCVLVDLCLTPAYGADGLKVIECVRLRCPAARIIVLTALGSPPTEAEALRLGADAFFQKPQPLDRLREAVGDLVGSGT